jgi:hypothetical protein
MTPPYPGPCSSQPLKAYLYIMSSMDIIRRSSHPH